MSKILETRIQNKIDTEENWNANSHVIPLKGEAIIYDIDAEHDRPRLKFGDGVTTVVNLPFVTCPDCNTGSDQPDNPDTPVDPDTPPDSGDDDEGETTLETVYVPKQSGTITYDGSTKSPTWNNYDATKMTMSGDTVAINAGTYSVTFTPKEGYCWEDQSTESKSVSWSIKKAVPSLTFEENIILTSDLFYTDLIITTNSDGLISVISADENIAKVSTLDNTYRVESVSVGETTLAITIAETSNYSSKSSSANVTVQSIPKTTLNEYTWEEISNIAKSGNADKYFDIGDIKQFEFKEGSYFYTDRELAVKPEDLGGPLYAYIIGFNHDDNLNTIDFQLFKDSVYTDCIVVDHTMGRTIGVDDYQSYVMFTEETTNKSWKFSHMRENLLHSDEDPAMYGSSKTGYLHALYEELTDVIIPMTVYYNTFTTVDGKTVDAYESSMDYLSLPSAYEIFGKGLSDNEGYTISAASRENQYDYYANGNISNNNTIKCTKIELQGNDSYYNKESNACSWWLRSREEIEDPENNKVDRFHFVTTDGTLDTTDINRSLAVCPIFRIGQPSTNNTTTYSITNRLANVINSNNVTSITGGVSYQATLTPSEGHTLSSVSITMGGEDITSAVYADGEININNVTGNIVIVATAYTNLEEPEEPEDTDDPQTPVKEYKWSGTVDVDNRHSLAIDANEDIRKSGTDVIFDIIPESEIIHTDMNLGVVKEIHDNVVYYELDGVDYDDGTLTIQMDGIDATGWNITPLDYDGNNINFNGTYSWGCNPENSGDA